MSEDAKKCTRCREIKPVAAFAKTAKAKDGLQYYCRICQSEYYKAWRINRTSPTNSNNPKQKSASDKVYRAVKRGDLIKPDQCENRTPNCIGRINAHHDDYNKPFEVRWLCDGCHRTWHLENGPGANK